MLQNDFIILSLPLHLLARMLFIKKSQQFGYLLLIFTTYGLPRQTNLVKNRREEDLIEYLLALRKIGLKT